MVKPLVYECALGYFNQLAAWQDRTYKQLVCWYAVTWMYQNLLKLKLHSSIHSLPHSAGRASSKVKSVKINKFTDAHLQFYTTKSRLSLIFNLLTNCPYQINLSLYFLYITPMRVMSLQAPFLCHCSLITQLLSMNFAAVANRWLHCVHFDRSEI